MADLGYPEDAIVLIGNIYSESFTKIIGSHFDPTQPIPIQRGTIQGNTLSPYLFILFLEPLLRWLARDHLGYKFKTSNNTISSTAYADDLVIISSNIAHIQPQLEKINKFCQWANMGLGSTKCALTGCPNKSKLAPHKFTNFLQNQNISFRNQAIPILHQNEPYKYLGIYMVPSLTWKIQTHATTTKIQEQCKLLKNSCATMKQKIHITETVIRAGIAYSFYAVPFSLPTIHKLDKLLIRLQKSICGLPKSAPNVTIQLLHNLFGLNAFSLTQAYLRCIGEQLRDALNDPGILGSIYQGLTNYIFSLYGGSKNPTILTVACIHSPTTRSIYLLKTSGKIHFKKYMDGSHITKQPLETKWLTQRFQHPYINLKTSLRYIHKLYLFNITDIMQLTQNCGTKLMTIQDIKTQHGPITNIMHKIHQKLQILFCEPTCTITCPTTCSSHAPPLTLLQDFNIPPQTLLNPPNIISEEPTSSTRPHAYGIKSN